MLSAQQGIVRCVPNVELPSHTALTAAAARAAHLIVDNAPTIFADTLASPLLGEQADELIGYHRAHGAHLVLSAARAQVTCRSRYTEDRLADGAERGITQYVILGAGLDSFGYRSRLARRMRVFEVDHPATQQWKRSRLAAARIPVPDRVTFVPADLEAGSLTRCLSQAGFDRSRPAQVSWLGVTMYLTEEAIGRTLAELGGLAAGTEVIADYMLPAGLRDEIGSTYAELVSPVAAEWGEPWLSFFAPSDMSALLERHGFGSVRHIRQRDAVDAVCWDRSDSLRPAELSVLAQATIGPGQRASSAALRGRQAAPGVPR
jgi:methyltransferase (TIGR00027 family)